MHEWVFVDTCIWASFFGKRASPEKAAVVATFRSERQQRVRTHFLPT